jgi:formate transporter
VSTTSSAERVTGNHGDLYSPSDMARRAETIGAAKASARPTQTLLLAALAGAFIALGAEFATIVGTDTSLGYGPTRLLMGVAFSVGLLLVVLAGAELFTGNALIVVAWASGRVSTARILGNWLLVYLGNLVGSLLIVGLVYVGRVWALDGQKVGAAALSLAATKVSLDPLQAVALGILCNFLVCLAVWLTYSARTTTDKLIALTLPVAAFVASGFEHSVANMYIIPLGILLRGHAEIAQIVGNSPALLNLTWERFLIANLLPVTIGNIIGGGLMVGIAYWLAYIRPTRPAVTDGEPGRSRDAG